MVISREHDERNHCVIRDGGFELQIMIRISIRDQANFRSLIWPENEESMLPYAFSDLTESNTMNYNQDVSVCDPGNSGMGYIGHSGHSIYIITHTAHNGS